MSLTRYNKVYMNPEAKVAVQCISGVLAALLFYGALIVAAEIGGLSQGYPGRGIEIHEQVVKTLKQIFFGNKNNRRK